MKTLILKHGGYEAHVPYELPDSLRFDCFVPGHGVYAASVDVRVETIEVIDLRTQDGTGWIHPVELERAELAAVLEQAGDVCAVFERGLRALEKRGLTNQGEMDARVLSTIAEMALLESDLHTAWCRLPDALRTQTPEPEDDAAVGFAARALNVFIEQVLAPRAQDLATAAAKRREAEWLEENDREVRARDRLDAMEYVISNAVKAAKEGA